MGRGPWPCYLHKRVWGIFKLMRIWDAILLLPLVYGLGKVSGSVLWFSVRHLNRLNCVFFPVPLPLTFGVHRNQASVSREKSSILLDYSVHLIRNTHQHVQSSNPSFLISHMTGTSWAHDEKFRKARRKQGGIIDKSSWELGNQLLGESSYLL